MYFTTVYATHFFTGLTIATVLWLRSRDEWLRWMRRYLALNVGALVVYIGYPMAPPWMASQMDELGSVSRITGRGWSEIGLHRIDVVLQGVGNPVAAMPSLHAGTSFLIAMYAIQLLHSPGRCLPGSCWWVPRSGNGAGVTGPRGQWGPGARWPPAGGARRGRR